MNIYFYELRMYSKSALIWAISIVVMSLFFMSMFPGFEKDAEQMLTLLESYPKAMLKAFELNESLFSILGFYGYMFTYMALAGSIQAMNLGLGLVSREVRDKTVEFLLTKPVTRTQVLTGKLSAAVTLLLVFNVIFILISFFVVNVYKLDPFDGMALFYMSLSMFFIQLFFLGFGLFLSVIIGKIKSVIPLSFASVFGFFIVRALASITEDSWLTYFTPFSYFDMTYIREHSTYHWPYFILSVGLSFIFIGISYVIYNKKDISMN